MRKTRMTVVACLSFSFGVLIGVLLSPIKGGFGNNSGNSPTTNYYLFDQKENEQ